MAEILTQLVPVDGQKGYPQWGYVTNPDAPVDQQNIDFTLLRRPDSVRYRETNGPFKQDATYLVEIHVPGFPAPFTSRMLGSQIAGQDAERQANYPFGRIPELPLYYEVTAG